MAEIERVCGSCSSVMPMGWNRKECPVCGGRVKVNIRQKKPAKVKRSIKNWTRDRPLAPTAPQSSVLGPRFLSASPLLLFVLNIFTLGLRSIFWVNYHLPALISMTSGHEMVHRSTLWIWLASYAAFLLSLGMVAWDLLSAAFDPSLFSSEQLLLGAIAAFVVSHLIGRHLLLWMRNVIMDTLDKSEHDVVRVRMTRFAGSELLLWFIGVPYIQFHINRMIKKKGLQGYGEVRRLRRVEQWLAAVRGPDGELPPQKPKSRYLKN
ncbi:MAG: hypothetical protein LBI74_08165 [Synergistaceae bacterium]|jgi:hypothetical protein|nr:hypothetical protein [Synergistaceae bacterium]